MHCQQPFKRANCENQATWLKLVVLSVTLLTCDEVFVPQRDADDSPSASSAGWPAVTGLFFCPSLFGEEKT